MSAKARSRKRETTGKVGPDDWQAWCAHLAERETPEPLWQLLPPSSVAPATWGMTTDGRLEKSGEWLDRLHQAICRRQSQASWLIGKLEDWLERAEDCADNRTLAFESLGWATALPNLSSFLPAAPWCEVIEFLQQSIKRALDTGDSLASQLMTVELPLTLAYLFPELPACRRLGPPAIRELSRAICTTVDGNGLPEAKHLSDMRLLLACWTRCGYLLKTFPKASLSQQARLSFEWSLRQCLALSRDDGSQMLGGERVGRDVASLFEAALSLVDESDDRAIADQAFPWRSAYRAASQKETFFPEVPAHSEWGKVAILRPAWLRGSPRMVLAYDQAEMRTELTVGAHTLLAGDWSTHLQADGESLQPESDWSEICWHADDDVDYLELEMHYSGGWTLQRQLLMAREDHFLFAADALLGPREMTIRYESRLPLAAGVAVRAERETREVYLLKKQRAGMVLPLAQPEWRSSQATGALLVKKTGLRLIQEATASRLYVPVFIDLERSRQNKPVTWRHLTVARQLEIEPPTTAVGYRVQIGGDQWLFYRSLSPAENRTVLGQNLLNEFYAARFDTDGTTEELIAIVAEE